MGPVNPPRNILYCIGHVDDADCIATTGLVQLLFFCVNRACCYVGLPANKPTASYWRSLDLKI